MVSRLTQGFELIFPHECVLWSKKKVYKTLEKEQIHHPDAFYSVTWDSFYAISPWLEVFPPFVLVVEANQEMQAYVSFL